MGGNDGSFKYEDIYPHGSEGVPALRGGLGRYFPFGNDERPHQAPGYRTPAAVYRGGRAAGESAGGSKGMRVKL